MEYARIVPSLASAARTPILALVAPTVISWLPVVPVYLGLLVPLDTTSQLMLQNVIANAIMAITIFSMAHAIMFLVDLISWGLICFAIRPALKVS